MSRHPYSFWLTVLIAITTAGLTVVWSIGHLVALAVDIGLIVGLRFLAIWEGRRSLRLPSVTG